AEARGLDRDDLALLARNSFLGSFLTDDVVAAHLETLDAYVGANR
ncbi:MAG: adenosine deaminase, partial [Sphingomonas bacterium]